MWLSDLQILSVAWWVPLVKQELLTLPYHLSSPLVISRNGVAQSLIFYVVVCRPLFLFFVFSPFSFGLLQFRDSDYPLGIFKLLLSFLTVIGSTFSSGVQVRGFDLVGGSKQRLWHYYFFSTNHRALLKNRKDSLAGSKDISTCGLLLLVGWE